MDALLKAIRARLTGDAELTSLVSADDITSSYNAEYANYPCVVMEIESGGTAGNIYGTATARVVINIYSRENKQFLWIVYDRIKTLLHNSEHEVSNSTCIIHAIYESHVSDDQYDLPRDVWRIGAKYDVLYGKTGLFLTTGASGKVFADHCSVSASEENEITEFRGQLSLEIAFSGEMRRERERFGKTLCYNSGNARLIIEEVIFKASVLDLLWNTNTNSDGKLNDGLTSATNYIVSQNSRPSYLQVLFQTYKTDDGKKLEIEARRAVCQSVKIPFTKTDFSVFDCQWILLSDSLDDIVTVSVEN